jgi:threonine dehydrogenase-like Zn-dependent dehydrogenase
MSTLEEYKAGHNAIPQQMQRWHLYGAGLESLGQNGQPEVVEVPTYGDDELLVRQDACGLCFSDTKVIALGENHPRMTGRNLATDPVTLGHEVTCTVVGVGSNRQEQFHIGDRFVVQADVFYQGKSMAYGYAIKGGLAQYSVIPKEVIDGDEGCYLLPIRPDTGYVESALTEPWACVVSAYAQAHRDGIKAGGRMLIMGGSSSEALEYDWKSLLSAERTPSEMVLWNVKGSPAIQLTAWAEALGVKLSHVNATDWQALQAYPDIRFDDILVLGNVSEEAVEGAATTLANHGIMNFVGGHTFSRKLNLDIGRIHYNWHYYLGTATNNPAQSYAENRNADLVPNGIAWFIGAGGPMGQMHVQRAVQHWRPARRIVATDVDAVRLQSVIDRFGGIAAERGIELVAINPKEMSPEEFNARLSQLSEERGFDDIISMVPVAALIEHAADYLAEGGWFNIFAGVARGTMAYLDVNTIIQRRGRYLGSSGSSLSDMRETLSRVERDELSTNASLAAIGGMEAAAIGLRAVKEGWFPGKTLIFPNIQGLPLTPLAELQERLPNVFSKLKDGKFWTNEAEEELLKTALTK